MDVGAKLRAAGIDRDYAHISIPMGVILTLVTCGIYNLVWNYKQMAILNALLDDERFSFMEWLLLSLVTCGIYHLYYEYKMAEAIADLQRQLGHRVNDSLAMMSLLMSIFGFSIAVDAIHQDEINEIVS